MKISSRACERTLRERNATDRPRARNTNPVRGEHSRDGDEHGKLSVMEVSRNSLGINDITDVERWDLTKLSTHENIVLQTDNGNVDPEDHFEGVGVRRQPATVTRTKCHCDRVACSTTALRRCAEYANTAREA
jgi:hypothetical protein